MRAWRGAVAVTVFVGMSAGVLAGCSSEESVNASSSAASPSASPSPTGPPPEVVWAAQFCTDRKKVNEAVGSFGRGLKIDTSGDVVDQLDKQLRVDALVVGKALGDLIATLALVPPELPGVAGKVSSVTQAGTQLQTSLTAVGDQITAVTQSDGLLDAATKVPAAITAASEAYTNAETFLKDSNAAFNGDDPALRAAMAQAPECDGL